MGDTEPIIETVHYSQEQKERFLEGFKKSSPMAACSEAGLEQAEQISVHVGENVVSGVAPQSSEPRPSKPPRRQRPASMQTVLRRWIDEARREEEQVKEKPGDTVPPPSRVARTRLKTKPGVLSSEDLVVSRDSGVSVLFDPLTKRNEEKIRVYNKVTKQEFIIDVPLAIALRAKGLKWIEIEKYMGVPEEMIYEAVEPYMTDKELETSVELYEENRASMLNTVAARLLSGITPDKVAKANLKDTATAFGIVYDRSRLEENKSTGNMALGLAGLVNQVHAEREGKKEESMDHSATVSQGQVTTGGKDVGVQG